MLRVVTALCVALCFTANANKIVVDDTPYFNQVYEAIGNDLSLLKPLTSIIGGDVITKALTDQIDNSTACTGCIAAMATANEIANLPGPGYPVWRLTIIATCKQLLNSAGVDGDLVCAGLCDSYGPHIFDILDTGNLDNRYICENQNVCDRPELYDPIDVKQAEPEASKEKVTKQKRAAKEANKQPAEKKNTVPENAIKVAMVTDVHIEHKYTVGAPSQCNVWVCCRDDVTGTGSARQWGEYVCNTAPHTFEVFLSQVADLQPDFVLYGGDGPPHSQWDESQAGHLNMTSWIARKFQEHIPGVNVYPTVGNHDGYPANLYYVPREETQEQNRYFADDWETAAGFGPEQRATIEYSGYYTKEIMPGLRMLSFNGNYGYTFDWYNLLSMHEDVAPTMYRFMEDTLQAARDNGEKVIMFSHHPMGGGDTLVESGQILSDLIIRYRDVITLMPTGHTHQTQIRLVVDQETGEAAGMIYVSGVISTYSNANPSVTIFYLDPVTFELLDYDLYYNHLDDQVPEEEPQLGFSYRATEEYGLPDLSPASWLDLTYRFEEDDALFQQYLDNRNSRVNPGGSECDEDCKHNIICGMRSSDFLTYRRCQLGII